MFACTLRKKANKTCVHQNVALIMAKKISVEYAKKAKLLIVPFFVPSQRSLAFLYFAQVNLHFN